MNLNNIANWEFKFFVSRAGNRSKSSITEKKGRKMKKKKNKTNTKHENRYPAYQLLDSRTIN